MRPGHVMLAALGVFLLSGGMIAGIRMGRAGFPPDRCEPARLPVSVTASRHYENR